MPAKFERCVDHVKDSGKADGVNPWAVCHASTQELKPTESDKLLTELDDIISGDASFPPADASYKHTGNMVPTKSDHSYDNTLPEENLKEIDDMISKTASFPNPDASYKHSGGMTTKLKPYTFGNTDTIMHIKEDMKISGSPLDILTDETVSIPGSLSAVKIQGKKHEAHSMQETIYKSILDKKLNSCGCSKKKLRIKETASPFIRQIVGSLAMKEAEEGEWITIKGAHIQIKPGENKDEAIKNFFAKGKKEPSTFSKFQAEKKSQKEELAKLSPKQKEVLEHINKEKYGSHDSRDISDDLTKGKEKFAYDSALSNLASDGYLEERREKFAQPGKGRRVSYTMTDKGKKLLADVPRPESVSKAPSRLTGVKQHDSEEDEKRFGKMWDQHPGDKTFNKAQLVHPEFGGKKIVGGKQRSEIKKINKAFGGDTHYRERTRMNRDDQAGYRDFVNNVNKGRDIGRDGVYVSDEFNPSKGLSLVKLDEKLPLGSDPGETRGTESEWKDTSGDIVKPGDTIRVRDGRDYDGEDIDIIVTSRNYESDQETDYPEFEGVVVRTDSRTKFLYGEVTSVTPEHDGSSINRIRTRKKPYERKNPLSETEKILIKQIMEAQVNEGGAGSGPKKGGKFGSLDPATGKFKFEPKKVFPAGSPFRKKEGGPGSGIKGHTTSKDEPTQGERKHPDPRDEGKEFRVSPAGEEHDVTIKGGDIVAYSNPENEAEMGERFSVVEDREDRVIIQDLKDDSAFPGQMAISKHHLVNANQDSPQLAGRV